ncbi:hypothetical protein ACPEEZ_06575 [Frigoribacterium sp. 2-23]|uniref:hypothetical protein n=1 Tax=Frigoribacterium sp. 2-23 TaxID=3415006 RepID=UPI003C6ECD4A
MIAPFVHVGRLFERPSAPDRGPRATTGSIDDARDGSLVWALAEAGLPVLDGVVVTRAGGPGREDVDGSEPSVADAAVHEAITRLCPAPREAVFLVTSIDGSLTRTARDTTVLAALRHADAADMSLVRVVPDAVSSGSVTGRDPVTGADETVITAWWGVRGVVGADLHLADAPQENGEQRPDVVVLDEALVVVQRSTGHKTIALHPRGAMLVPHEVNLFRRAAEIVDDDLAHELAMLVRHASAATGRSLRLDWVVVDGQVSIIRAGDDQALGR